MYFYLNVEDMPLVLAVVEPNGVFSGSNILTINEIMGNEVVYSSFKASYPGCRIEVIGKKKRPVLVLDMNNPHVQNLGQSLVDFTPIVAMADENEQTGRFSADVLNNLIVETFNETNLGLGITDSVFNIDIVLTLFNTYRRLFAYIEGTLAFPVVLDEVDRIGLEDNIREVNEAAVLTSRSRLYTDNRINTGSPMKVPTDRCFFRVVGPRAIFENSADYVPLKPDIWTVYTKDHIEMVKSYPRAFNNPDLRGSAVNIDAPIAKSEQDLYVALCQMMADSIRLPKTDFMYANDEESTEEEAEDEELVDDSADLTGKKAKVELPPGKMYSCRSNEVLDMTDDDEYMVSNGRLDKEVEDYMMFLVKTAGSWNWAYTGCFPHGMGYSEVLIDANGGVTFIDPSKVPTSMASDEEFISTYDLQDTIVANQYAKMGGADITSRQLAVERYVRECYKQFGPKVFAEAIIKLLRWGNRRPNKLHLGESSKYFNLITGTMDTKSGDISSMKVKEVDGKVFEVVAVITATETYKDKVMYSGENRFREVTGFPVGVVLRTTYVNKNDESDVDYRWTYMSLLDLVVNNLTGNSKECPAYINMDPNGVFTIDRDLIIDNELFNEGYSLSNVPSDTAYSVDGNYVTYISEQLSNLLLLLKVDQKSFGHLQSYEYVRSEAVISSEINKFDEPRIDKIRDYIKKHGQSVVDHLSRDVHMYLHNLYDEFMLYCVEKYCMEILGGQNMQGCGNNIVFCTAMYGTSETTIDGSVMAFVLEYFLNTLSERVRELDYRGEGMYCTGADFISAYNVRIPEFITGSGDKGTPNRVTQPASKMNLAGEDKDMAIFKEIPSNVEAQPLLLKSKTEDGKLVGVIYVAQDNYGIYGVIANNVGQRLSDKPITATKIALLSLVIDAIAFEADSTGEVGASMQNNKFNRIYFEDARALVSCRKAINS